MVLATAMALLAPRALGMEVGAGDLNVGEVFAKRAHRPRLIAIPGVRPARPAIGAGLLKDAGLDPAAVDAELFVELRADRKHPAVRIGRVDLLALRERHPTLLTGAIRPEREPRRVAPHAVGYALTDHVGVEPDACDVLGSRRATFDLFGARDRDHRLRSPPASSSLVGRSREPHRARLRRRHSCAGARHRSVRRSESHGHAAVAVAAHRDMSTDSRRLCVWDALASQQRLGKPHAK